jgi:ferredoxin
MRNGSEPRLTALLAAAAEPMPPVSVVEMQSDGVLLIYGCDERAIEAARSLADRLDVTVLMTPEAVLPRQEDHEFPVAIGRIRSATGYLGAFEVTVDAFAPTVNSSGGTLREGARSRCDVILDVSGERSLFPDANLRDGYVRADPRDLSGTLAAAAKARDLKGTFEKPRYINFTEHLCAHSRSRITGCTRCLDLCPAGAVAPSGDHVAINANICAGCGQCASACPTGAAAYELPPSDALVRKLRTLLLTFRGRGGENPILLIHDESQGSSLIDALGTGGESLPFNVLPFAVNEVTQVGLETLAAAFAFGSTAVRFLLPGRARHDISGLKATLSFAEPILAGLGFGPNRIALLETDDPGDLLGMLAAVPEMSPAPRPASFLPLAGDKRAFVRFVLGELNRASPTPADIIPLPQRAPFGGVKVDAAGCTLCLACVSACPTGALKDNLEQPMLSFTESACIQCGLCKATCPENVISLNPQLDFRTTTAVAQVLKSEQPFCCIRCGKPFGVRSTIERVTAKLAGSHWMYKDAPKRLDLIKMCDDCRVGFVFEENIEPHMPQRASVRTTDDYLRERAERESPPDEEVGGS